MKRDGSEPSELETLDDFEEPKILQKYNKKRVCNRVLISLLLVLLVACLVFVILYAELKQRVNGGASEQQQTHSASGSATANSLSTSSNNILPSATVCLTPICIKSAAEVMSFMNFSVDPCENFYEYACGGWAEENDIPDTESSWGQFSILTLKNDHFLKKAINDPVAKAKYKDNKAVMKAFKYYDACMDTSHINQLGAKPILDLIESLGSWNISRNGSWDASKFNFLDAMVRFQTYLVVPPFFDIVVGADYGNSSLNVIKFDQSGLGLSRDVYLQNTTDYKKIRQAYKKLMIQTVALLGAEGEDVERQLMEVYNLEEQLANITIPIAERRNIEKNYKKLTVKEFQKSTGDFINWKEFLARVFKPYGLNVTDDFLVAVHALDYLQNISEIYHSASNTTIVNYMMWHVIRTYMSALSDDFKKILQDYKEVSSGTTQEEPKWRQCLSSASIPFGMPLGLIFINEKFTRKSKLMVEELIREIRDIFIKNLDQVDWMDKQTRVVAQEKARRILENIGYPEFLQNKTALEKNYEGLDPTDNYFKNVLKNSVYFINKKYARINEPVDNKEWVMDPQIVNAYYSFSKNKIVFPAGILQSPFYDKDRPRSINYGGIGAVVGHEITHGFDDNGRRFNKEGNLRKWWSNHSIEAFTNKTKCLIDQYSKYKFFGESINGKQTLGENIADNGGVKQAYQAYQRYVARKGHERLLPGLNTTNDQLFFLGFAQVWCGKFRRQTAVRQVATGVHTPGMYRVIGTLSNSEGFANAYKCAPGTAMNPKKKCHVW